MAPNAWLVLVLALAAVFLNANASDPDLISDYITPSDITPNSDFFTFKGFTNALSTDHLNFSSFKPTLATEVSFPALKGQGVSYAVLQFGPQGINRLHTHPRASELLLVLQGRLNAGFIDTTNKLFAQNLVAGDVFVFPKGMVHFVVNPDDKYPAVAVSALGSAGPGIVDLPMTLFGSKIGTDVLAKSFKTDAHTIDLLSWSTINV